MSTYFMRQKVSKDVAYIHLGIDPEFTDSVQILSLRTKRNQIELHDRDGIICECLDSTEEGIDAMIAALHKAKEILHGNK